MFMFYVILSLYSTQILERILKTEKKIYPSLDLGVWLVLCFRCLKYCFASFLTTWPPGFYHIHYYKKKLDNKARFLRLWVMLPSFIIAAVTYTIWWPYSYRSQKYRWVSKDEKYLSVCYKYVSTFPSYFKFCITKHLVNYSSYRFTPFTLEKV